MAQDEQHEGDARGGVGTITRTGDRRARGQPARPVPAPRPAADPRHAGTDPRLAGTVGAPWRVPPAQPREHQPREHQRPAVAGPHRMPFVLLLCGLLGGALISALVISTTLAEGSFEITKLQGSTNALARQRQALEDQVAQAQSAPVIAGKAAKLGMREITVPRYIDLKNGKITTDAGARQSYIPRYMP